MSERSVDSLHPMTLEEVVFQALGEATMCWEPRPEGVFDSEAASKVGYELLTTLRARGAK